MRLIVMIFFGVNALLGMGVAYSYVGSYCINSYGSYAGYSSYGCTAASIPTLNHENTILLVLILIAIYSICMNPKKKIKAINIK